MTQREMVNKLVELGYGILNSSKALKLTNFNFEEAKELLHFHSGADMALEYEVLKLIKRVEKLEKDKSE